MLYAVALTFLPGLTQNQALEIIRETGDAEAALLHPQESLQSLNEQMKPYLIHTIERGRKEALEKAQMEVNYCQKHSIQILSITSPDYPERLRQCPDPPIVLYYRGNVSLNPQYSLSTVGTRKITEYGKRMCSKIMKELAKELPDTLVVSGLAYGVDIHAQRAAYQEGMATIGVVAHGLDQIYPAAHRNDAVAFCKHGGIITEYAHGTEPLQGNFLRRNRIIAGMTDATLVVESAEHGGSLVTARLANEYNRPVFACPGRVTDLYSVGCNMLIKKQEAYITTCAEDIIHEIGWWEHTNTYKSKPRQLELFSNTNTKAYAFTDSHKGSSQTIEGTPQLPSDQQQILDALSPTDGLSAQQLCAQTGLTTAVLTTLLFQMEMAGLIKTLPGGVFINT